MSNEAEQSEELEVLASIFPEEFQVLEDGHSFKLLLKPNTDGGDNHGKYTCSTKCHNNAMVTYD